MTDQKPPAENIPGDAGAESGGGTSSNLGGMDSGQIQESAFQVFKTAARQSDEDVKNIMGEHMKGAEAGGPDDLHLQDSGEGGLDDIKLQDFDQHQSRGLQLATSVVKKRSDTSGSIVSKFGDGGGGSSPEKKKTGLSLLTGLLLLGIAVFVGVRFFAPRGTQTDTTTPNSGPPEVNVTAPAVPDQPVGWPPNPCGLQFENPAGPEGIPLSGPLDVQWSRLPGAASYEFRVIPPEGAGDPWLISTDRTSKKIYMENFPAAGQHKFALTALDRGGASLCSIEVVFDKLAFGGEAGQARDSEAAAGECNTLGPCVP